MRIIHRQGRRTLLGAAIVALVCVTLTLPRAAGTQAQSQQCYSASTGYSCTSYGSNGQITSVSNCLDDGQGNDTCTSTNPGSAPSASVCIQNTCRSGSGALGSQCFSSNTGYSCSNYGASGQVTSASNCSNDSSGNVSCVTTSPGSSSTTSVCLEGTCGPARAGGPTGTGSTTPAAAQRPSISLQRCTVPGRGTVWVPSQMQTGQLIIC